MSRSRCARHSSAGTSRGSGSLCICCFLGGAVKLNSCASSNSASAVDGGPSDRQQGSAERQRCCTYARHGRCAALHLTMLNSRGQSHLNRSHKPSESSRSGVRVDCALSQAECAAGLNTYRLKLYKFLRSVNPFQVSVHKMSKQASRLVGDVCLAGVSLSHGRRPNLRQDRPTDFD